MDYIFGCIHIRTPHSNSSRKTYWTHHDFISYGYDLYPMSALENEAIDDVSNYNKELDDVLELEKQVNSMKDNIEVLNEKLINMKNQVGSIAGYFFPRKRENKGICDKGDKQA